MRVSAVRSTGAMSSPPGPRLTELAHVSPLPAYVDGLEPEKRADLYEALAPGFFAPVAGRAEKHGEKDSDPTGTLLTLLIAELKKRTDSESA